MPPLLPGDKIWPELLEEAEHKKAMEAAAADAAAAQQVSLGVGRLQQQQRGRG